MLLFEKFHAQGSIPTLLLSPRGGLGTHENDGCPGKGVGVRYLPTTADDKDICSQRAIKKDLKIEDVLQSIM